MRRMLFERDPRKFYAHDHVLKWTVIPLVPRFISPNHVTVFRMVFTPVMLWLLWKGVYTMAVPLFLFLAFTDALDGTLARVRRQITDWGTFYDPVADKFLIGSVAILVVAQHLNLWLAGVMVAVELLISTAGFLRRTRGRHLSANVFGKTKMVLQVLGISLLLFSLWFTIPVLVPFAAVVLAISVAFAVISLFTYGL